jgi:hypothetical protein
VPLVQGQLRGEKLSFTIESECGHCHRPLHIEIDSDLNYRVVEADAEPVIYAPLLDAQKLQEPSIIDAF